jgi:hypothetical protein
MTQQYTIPQALMSVVIRLKTVEELRIKASYYHQMQPPFLNLELTIHSNVL